MHFSLFVVVFFQDRHRFVSGKRSRGRAFVCLAWATHMACVVFTRNAVSGSREAYRSRLVSSAHLRKCPDDGGDADGQLIVRDLPPAFKVKHIKHERCLFSVARNKTEDRETPDRKGISLNMALPVRLSHRTHPRYLEPVIWSSLVYIQRGSYHRTG